CVSVAILRERFGIPRYRVGRLSHSPGSAAITLVVTCTVICPAGMLNRRMKSDVRDVYSRSKRHAKGLNRAIEVLIVQGILIVPDAGSRIRDFVTHEPDAVVTRIGLNLIHGRACPCHDGGLLSHGGAHGTKTERLVDSSYVVPMVRSVIVHVALARMTLAPRVFVWDNVLGFGKICRSRI